MPHEERVLSARRVTEGDCCHFFGYYDKCPWDAAQRWLLGMRVAFMHRQPTGEDLAVIGMMDLERGGLWRTVAETRAWHWQQGAMLQWLPSDPSRKVIFNSQGASGYTATILDLETGERRTLPRPIYALSPDGRQAVTLNFSRVHRARPGYGYVGLPDPWAADPAPSDDGIYLLDLESGESRLVVRLADLARYDPEPSMAGALHWVNHLQFNPDGTRFVFLHRWRDPESPARRTRMYTARPDGSDLYYLGREGMVSHFDWRDPEHLLAWSLHDSEAHYHLYRDGTQDVEVVGGDVLEVDGHCSYSPDRRWILTDTYPRPGRPERTLILYEVVTNRRIDVGHYYAAPEVSGEIRCDLHPRWSRDGAQVCFDSIHEGDRQMYTMDVSAVLGI